MIQRLEGIVETITAERPGAQQILVRPLTPNLRSALNIIALTGHVAAGDRVLLNTVAVEMGLGTGGLDFVVSAPSRQESVPPPGHILKLRYTPLQTPVLAVESPESQHHKALCHFTTLHETPVVCM